MASVGTLTMTGGEVRIGNGVLTLGGDVTINASAAGSRITSTDLNDDLVLNGSARTFTAADGAAVYDLDMQADVYDGTLVSTGAGTLRLALASGTALGTGGGTFTLAGSTVVADGGTRTISNPVSVTGSATFGASLDGTPHALTFSGATTISADVTLTDVNLAGVTLATVNLGANNLTLTGNAAPAINTLNLIGNGTLTNTVAAGVYVRLAPRSTAGEHSTGLGLSIVKQLVEAMGGTVRCRSELGHGTTFAVELPAV